MDSEERRGDSRTIYNVILLVVTILGLACGIWMHFNAPTPPKVRLDSFSASYTLKTASKNATQYAQRQKYDDTTFYMDIVVRNDDRELPATFELVDVWVNVRVREFQRMKLGQELNRDTFALQPGEEKVMKVKVRQDRPIRLHEWDKLLVSVLVKAQFPGNKDFLGHHRTVQRTRDCADLNATLHKDTSTAVVESGQLPKWCNAPY